MKSFRTTEELIALSPQKITIPDREWGMIWTVVRPVTNHDEEFCRNYFRGIYSGYIQLEQKSAKLYEDSQKEAKYLADIDRKVKFLESGTWDVSTEHNKQALLRQLQSIRKELVKKQRTAGRGRPHLLNLFFLYAGALAFWQAEGREINQSREVLTYLTNVAGPLAGRHLTMDSARRCVRDWQDLGSGLSQQCDDAGEGAR